MRILLVYGTILMINASILKRQLALCQSLGPTRARILRNIECVHVLADDGSSADKSEFERLNLNSPSRTKSQPLT
jgi:hypothetical protein